MSLSKSKCLYSNYCSHFPKRVVPLETWTVATGQLLEHLSSVTKYDGLNTVVNVIKLFTTVIYLYSIVIPSFCVVKRYYLGNYCGIAVNYCGVLTLEKVGLKLLWQFTVVLFYNIGPKCYWHQGKENKNVLFAAAAISYCNRYPTTFFFILQW